MNEKEGVTYIGDGVYMREFGHGVDLFTSDGVIEENRIWFDEDTEKALFRLLGKRNATEAK